MAKYKVIWHSPRGFANEGNYIYGDDKTLEELADTLGVWGNVNCEWTEMSSHNTLDNAKKAAEKICTKDRKGHTNWHEDAYFSVLSATEFLAEEKQALL